MNHQKGPLQWMKDKLTSSNEDSSTTKKKTGKFQYFLIILVVGIGLMFISDVFKGSTSNQTADVTKQTPNPESVATFGKSSQTKDTKAIKDYEDQYETVLKDALEQVQGVGKVNVIVNLDNTESKVYERNTVTQNQTTVETDQKGGERKVEDASKDNKVVIIKDGEKEVPLVSETKKPLIRGVMIVAEGAENISVKKMIVDAVMRSLDVPSFKISVMPKKS